MILSTDHNKLNFIVTELGEEEETLYNKIKSHLTMKKDDDLVLDGFEPSIPDTSCIFIDYEMFDHFLSFASSMPEGIQNISRKFFKIKNNAEINKIIDSLHHDFGFSKSCIDLKPNSCIIRYPKGSAFAQQVFWMCMITIFMRMMIDCIPSFMVTGYCINYMDGKAKHTLCKILAKYGKQSIIFTDRIILHSILSRPGHDSNPSLYKDLQSKQVLGNVYELKKGKIINTDKN